MTSVAINADVSVPVLSTGADAFLDGFVVELTGGAVDSADVPVVGLTAGAFALVGDVVVHSTASADHAGDAVPG